MGGSITEGRLEGYCTTCVFFLSVLSCQKAGFSPKTGSLSHGERAGVRGEHYRGPSRVNCANAYFLFVRLAVVVLIHFAQEPCGSA